MAIIPSPRRPPRRLTDTERRDRWLIRVLAPLREVTPPDSLGSFVQALHHELPQQTRQLAGVLQRQIAAFDGGKERQAIIRTAVRSSSREFFSMLEGTSPHDPTVPQSFRQMGFGLAVEGNTLEPMHAALRIAHLRLWRLLYRTAIAHQVGTDFVGRIGEALDLYVAHLEEEAAHGHSHGLRMHNADRGLLRAQLLEELRLDDYSSDPEERWSKITVLAAGADWPIPTEVVAMRVAFHGAFPALAEPHHDILTETRQDPALLVCTPARAEQVAAELLLHEAVIRIAISLPAAPNELVGADRSARRTLDLVKLQEALPHRVLHSGDHLYQLWLHSEPMLRRHLAQEMLQPLMTERPRSRRILAETLLAWMATRDSAPILAERMGVHPQTIRYRQRRMREVFGDLLDDPEFIAVASLTLRASLPFWRIGEETELLDSATRTAPPPRRADDQSRTHDV